MIAKLHDLLLAMIEDWHHGHEFKCIYSPTPLEPVCKQATVEEQQPEQVLVQAKANMRPPPCRWFVPVQLEFHSTSSLGNPWPRVQEVWGNVFNTTSIPYIGRFFMFHSILVPFLSWPALQQKLGVSRVGSFGPFRFGTDLQVEALSSRRESQRWNGRVFVAAMTPKQLRDANHPPPPPPPTVIACLVSWLDGCDDVMYSYWVCSWPRLRLTSQHRPFGRYFNLTIGNTSTLNSAVPDGPEHQWHHVYGHK